MSTESEEITIKTSSLKHIKTISETIYHNLVSSNNPTHDEWSASSLNLKKNY